jgi:hypothetical protein
VTSAVISVLAVVLGPRSLLDPDPDPSPSPCRNEAKCLPCRNEAKCLPIPTPPPGSPGTLGIETAYRAELSCSAPCSTSAEHVSHLVGTETLTLIDVPERLDTTKDLPTEKLVGLGWSVDNIVGNNIYLTRKFDRELPIRHRCGQSGVGVSRHHQSSTVTTLLRGPSRRSATPGSASGWRTRPTSTDSMSNYDGPRSRRSR